MKEGDRLLFSKSVEYSEILKFPSTKDFLTACTDGTIDDSTLRSRIQNWNSGNFKVADFSKLLIELKCLYNRIVAPVTPTGIRLLDGRDGLCTSPHHAVAEAQMEKALGREGNEAIEGPGNRDLHQEGML
ncbi:hypothetical protein BM1_06726 [Bipolaris maydis]|nr:hypothetical protein BM1_06726 [Bipolaris maydis]